MMSTLSQIQNRISFRSFGFGLCGVVGVYGALLVYALINQVETINNRESLLASQTILIEWDKKAESLSPAPYGPYKLDAPSASGEDVSEMPAHTPVTDHKQEDHPETRHTPPAASGPLPRAPIDGLYEDTTAGRLPMVRKSDHLTPFNAYRKSFTPINGTPYISITFLDFGISDVHSQTLIGEMPGAVTFAVNPYALAPDFWVNEARADGHEIWMMMPMETQMYPMDDPGPQTLLINGVEKQNINKLHWMMSRAQGITGFVTDYGPAFLKSANDARPVLNDLYLRGLGFVDGDSSPSDMPQSMALGLNAPYARVDTWIDEPDTPEHIAASLRQLEVLAKSNGYANGFVRLSPMTLEMVKTWIDGLSAKNLVLAPLSAQATK